MEELFKKMRPFTSPTSTSVTYPLSIVPTA
jgi:hypothetical protein